jgi:hypothetical protein
VGLGNTYKVNTDGRNVRLSVCIVCESKQQTRLSYTGVSDEEEFEKVVAVVVDERKQRHRENRAFQQNTFWRNQYETRLKFTAPDDEYQQQAFVATKASIEHHSLRLHRRGGHGTLLSKTAYEARPGARRDNAASRSGLV